MFIIFTLMINNIKTEFTIKDLENLSGIKAHTIRIWEKRYQLFKPKRTDTNIRYYSIQELQKLLNVTLLYNHGLKISKIAALSSSKLISNIKELSLKKGVEATALNVFKISMLNFDEARFNEVFEKLIREHSFRYIFKNILIPFLNEIGLLWQIESIFPAHEHFISNLIKQKIYANIDAIDKSKGIEEQDVYILFLPLNEIHDIGLLYIHYELLLHGHRSIYLGQSIPDENIIGLQASFKKVKIVTYLTVEPSQKSTLEYLENISQNFKKDSSHSIHAIGQKTKDILSENVQQKQIFVYHSPLDFLKLV